MTRSFADSGVSVDITFHQTPVFAGHSLTGVVTLVTAMAARSPTLTGGALNLIFAGEESGTWKTEQRGFNQQRYCYTVNLASPKETLVGVGSPHDGVSAPVTIPTGRTLVFPFSFPVPSDALPTFTVDESGARGNFKSRHTATVVLTPHLAAGLDTAIEAVFDYTVATAIPRRLQQIPNESKPRVFTMTPCHDAWMSWPAQVFCCGCCLHPCCCSCTCCGAEDISVTTTLGQHAVIPGEPLPVAFEIRSTKKLISATYHLDSTVRLQSQYFVHTVTLNEKAFDAQPIIFSTVLADGDVARYESAVNVPSLVAASGENQQRFPCTTFEGSHIRCDPQLHFRLVFEGGAETFVIPTAVASTVDPTDMAGFNTKPRSTHTGTLPLRVPRPVESNHHSNKPLACLPEFPPVKVETHESGIQAL